MSFLPIRRYVIAQCIALMCMIGIGLGADRSSSVKNEQPSRQLADNCKTTDNCSVTHNKPRRNHPASTPKDLKAMLTPRNVKVVFQGGDQAENIGKTLQILENYELLKHAVYVTTATDTIPSVYQSLLKVSSFPASLRELAAQLNFSMAVTDHVLPESTRVSYPDVHIEVNRSIWKLDPSKQSNKIVIETLSRVNNISIETLPSNEPVSFSIVTYELEASIDTSVRLNALRLNSAIDEIRSINKDQVRVLTSKSPETSDRWPITVQLEGGDVTGNATKVLSIALDLGLVKILKHRVETGDTTESIYRKYLGLPVSPDLMDLARHLNKGSIDNLSIGEIINYPSARFTPYEWPKKYNLNSPGEKQAYQLLRENWTHLVTRVDTISTYEVDVIFRGYKLQLSAPSSSELNRAKAALSAIETKNVVLSFPRTLDDIVNPNSYSAREAKVSKEAASQDSNEHLEEPEAYWRSCCGPEKVVLEEGKQGRIADYVGLSSLPDSVNNCKNEQCPQIVILDLPIEAHPDLAGAVFEDDGSLQAILPPLVKDGKQNVAAATFNRFKDHATHLAGIIASRDNGFGFVGINPNAEIVSLNWLTLGIQPETLSEIITKRSQNGRFQIYLFANKWTLFLKDPSKFHGAEDRFQDRVARTIRDRKSVWVVAAGQNDSAAGDDISTFRREFAPMNLGDQENVIVVTTCDACNKLNPNPRLKQGASYSTSGLVHIAASGADIPSTVLGQKYATAGGTSQAAGLAAGVAAAMVSSWPNYYAVVPGSVKLRLQLTSRPFFDPSQDSKVAAGVLDGEMAVKDPLQSYIQISGGKLRSVIPKRWLKATITCVDQETGDPESILTSKILRIVQSKNTWVFYLSTPSVGHIHKVGPCLVGDSERDLPILLTEALEKIPDGPTEESFSLSAILDLLLKSKLQAQP